MARVSNGSGPARHILAGLAGAVLLTAGLGCDTTTSARGNVGEQTAASAVHDPVLYDIPKPAGFRLDADRSVAISSGRFRLARCEYGGRLGSQKVKQFYEEYMPSAGFDLRQWSLDQGEFNMRFESEAEVCTVRARESSGLRTVVVVEIAPKPQGSAIHESSPPTRRPR